MYIIIIIIIIIIINPQRRNVAAKGAGELNKLSYTQVSSLMDVPYLLWRNAEKEQYHLFFILLVTISSMYHCKKPIWCHQLGQKKMSAVTSKLSLPLFDVISDIAPPQMFNK